MIIFKLKCEAQHEFEGWFGASQDYDQQKKEGLLTCPVCHSPKVERQLAGTPMLKSSATKSTIPSTEVSTETVAAGGKRRRQPRAMGVDPVVLLKALHQHVQKHYHDVGKAFYQQAVDMQQGKIPAKPIYGEVTADERELLDEAAIEYAVVPKLSPKFDN